MTFETLAVVVTGEGRAFRAGTAAPHSLDMHVADSLAMFHTSIGDGKDGVAAFREKRSPSFTGRVSDLPAIF